MKFKVVHEMIPRSWSCGVALFSQNNRENIGNKSHATYQNLKRIAEQSEPLDEESDKSTNNEDGQENKVIVARPGLVVVKNAKSMSITAEKTDNPRILIFYPDCEIMLSEYTTKFNRQSLNIQNPLARHLLQINDVEEVILGGTYISIQKALHYDRKQRKLYSRSWKVLKPYIIATLLEYFSTGETQSKNCDIETDETTLIIKDLINTRIKPRVVEFHGDVDFASFDAMDGKVRLIYSKNDKLNTEAIATLNNIALNILKFYVPEVSSVVESFSK